MACAWLAACDVPFSLGHDLAGSGDGGGGGVPVCNGAPGWCEIPNTRLDAVCPPEPPDRDYTGRCNNVVDAWGGAVADPASNLLYLWGGGVSIEYPGNELYVLDLDARAMRRLTDPSPAARAREPCSDALVDGAPRARATYSGLVFLPDARQLYAFGGQLVCATGDPTDRAWAFDPTARAWRSITTTPPDAPRPDARSVPKAVYDPATGTVLAYDRAALWRFDPARDTFVVLNANAISGVWQTTPVLDPQRGLLIVAGNHTVRAFDVSGRDPTYAMQDWDARTVGCEGLFAAGYPGLAYDPTLDRVVGWAGGDTVYLFDPATRTCTTRVYPNGPGPAATYGVHGRWRYLPGRGVHVLVNRADQNAFALRLGP